MYLKYLLDNTTYENLCHCIFEHVITRFGTKDVLADNSNQSDIF